METISLSFDEIVFENRNKNYGAFNLRKSYNGIVGRACLFGIGIYIIACALPLIAERNKLKTDIIIDLGPTIYTPMERPKDEKPLEIKKQPEMKNMEQRITYKPIVSTSIGTIDDASSLTSLLESGNNAFDGIQSGIFDQLNEFTEPEIIKIEEEEPYIIVAEMPEFKGGEEEMLRYLSEHIKYPQIAREAGISGNVMVTFVVEKDGSITNIKLLRDIGGGCGEEALRVVSSMPKWIAGRQNGTPVRVQFNLPVTFTLLK